ITAQHGGHVLVNLRFFKTTPARQYFSHRPHSLKLGHAARLLRHVISFPEPLDLLPSIPLFCRRPKARFRLRSGLRRIRACSKSYPREHGIALAETEGLQTAFLTPRSGFRW